MRGEGGSEDREREGKRAGRGGGGAGQKSDHAKNPREAVWNRVLTAGTV